MTVSRLFFCWFALAIISVLPSIAASAAPPATLTLEVVHSLDHREFPSLIKAFEGNSPHQVNIQRIDPDELKSRLLIYAENGKLPDVIIAPSDFLGFHRHLSLSPINPEWITMPIDESVRQSASIDGELFGVPILSGNHLVLYSNQNLTGEIKPSWENMLDRPEQLPSEIDWLGWSFMEM